MRKDKWTLEELQIEAGKFDSRGEFQTGSRAAYSYAYRHGMLDVICSKMQPLRIFWTNEMLREEALKYTTIEEFRRANPSAYVLAHKRKITKQIYTYMRPNQTEEYSFEELQAEALKYSTRNAFAKQSSSAYSVCLKRNILEQVCTHMPKRVTATGQLAQSWTDEELRIEALKWNTKKEFRKNNPSAYKAAFRRKLLVNISTHMLPMRTYWTNQQLVEEALKYNIFKDFRENSKSAYSAAFSRGILNDICSHMDKKNEWTDEEIKQEAGKYSTRTELRNKNSPIYNAALRRKISDEAFAHMPEHVSLSGENNPSFKWTDEDIKASAIPYKSRQEFREKSSNTYSAAKKRKMLGEVCSHMERLDGSYAEKQLLAYLQSIDFNFKSTHFGKKYQIDCYSESLKIGIEFNGLYWHSHEVMKQGRENWSNSEITNYHLDKTKYFESIGIRIIHIWEHEWRERRVQVEDFLKSACGANKIRIGARKCEFKEITNKECKDFLDQTHIQGGPNNSLFSLGCFYKDNLIGVCSFGRHHRKSDVITLNRFACLPDHTVMGFLSKASKLAFEKFKTPIISWADYCKSQAKGYLAAGWTVEEVLKPDYFYYNSKTKQVISKQSRKKSIVKTPAGMTEKEHAELDGLWRIYDCGKIRLIYNPLASNPFSTQS
jgi:G:T-mismatch repair DNA endonuclease (very short patch repair protein)